jgi:hypothetical protein
MPGLREEGNVSRSTRIGLRGLAVALAALAGCVAHHVVASRQGTSEEAAVDAVGHVTVSAPMFTPIEAQTSGDRRLDFADLRTVKRLYDELRKPAFTSERKEYSRLALALAARIAGTQIDESTLRKEGTSEESEESRKEDGSTRRTTAGGATTPSGPAGTPAETMRKMEETDVSETTTTTTTRSDGTKDTNVQSTEKKTSRKTPDVPDAPAFPTVPTEVMTELLKLLDNPGQGNLNLPPDEMAGLIASNQALMLNLEEFHNVDGYDFVRGLESEYVPYKMHFNVTVEPGWYSRWYDYDGVVEMRVAADQDPVVRDTRSSRAAPSIVILGVSPAETAQTVTDFVAALDQFGAALDVAGSEGTVAAQAKAEYVRATAQRLQGIRGERTLSVAFPDSGTMRIRFQAARIADLVHRRDLQPVSRLLTALVLVRKDWEGETKDGSTRKFSLTGAVPSPETIGLFEARAEMEAAERRLLDLVSVESIEALFTTEDDKRAFRSLTRVEPDRVGPRRPPDLAVDLMETARFHLRRTMRSPEGATRLERVAEDVVTTNILTALEEKSGEMKRLLDGAEPRTAILKEQLKSRARLWQHARAWYDQEIEKSSVDCRHEPTGPDETRLPGCLRPEPRMPDHRSLTGIGCTVESRSYFTPTIFGSDGTWTPPRTSPFVDRPHGRLHAGCDVLKSWIPPWLGDARARMRITEARGFYRFPLVDLEAKTAELIAKTHVSADAAAAAARATGAVQAASLAAEAAQKALRVAHDDVVERQVQKIAAEGGEAKAAQVANLRLAEAQRAEAMAQAALDAHVVALSEAKARASVADQEAGARRTEELQARAEVLKTRTEVLKQGRVVVRFSVYFPRHIVDRTGLLEQAEARVRIAGLQDCPATFGCSDVELPRIPLKKAPTGWYDGVIDVSNVDLSFGVPPTVSGLDDLAKLKPIHVVLQAILLRKDRLGNRSDYESDEFAEQTELYETKVHPWTTDADPPPAKRSSGRPGGR